MTERLDHLLTADRDTLTRIAADPDTPPDEARLAAAILNEEDAMHASIDAFAAEHPADPAWLDAATPAARPWSAWLVSLPLVAAAAAVTAVVGWSALAPSASPPDPLPTEAPAEPAVIALADCGGRSLEAPAMLGQLKAEQISCLRTVDDPESSSLASRLLLAHFYAAQDTAAWESQLAWHLEHIRPIDPDLAAKASLHALRQGDTDEALRLARIGTSSMPADADAHRRAQAWGAHTRAATAAWRARQDPAARTEALEAGRSWLSAIDEISGPMEDTLRGQASTLCTNLEATSTCEEIR